jgi:hypothetical protein
MIQRRLFGSFFMLVVVVAHWACSSSNLPFGCEARCTPSDRTPTAIQCLSQDPGKCMTPNGGAQPRCDDGTPISILLCQNDSHAKCKNGAEPKCVPP